MNSQHIQENKIVNGKAIGSLIIGCVSILGIILIGYGAILSIAGILIGMIGLREIKQFKQNGKKLALAGIICNCLGVLSLII